MTNTPHLELPLLQASQAQKHVTVNEAFVRLDSLSQLTLKSIVTTTPPGLASEGDSYGVPDGAVNDWAGRDSEIAIWSNGGWIFCVPATGWKAWIEDIHQSAVFIAGKWSGGAASVSQSGAAFVQSTTEIDHVISAGATSTIADALPEGAVVFGITGRVTSAFGGGLSGWKLGVAGSEDRYGSSLGLATGSWLRGMTSSPLTYYSSTDLILTGEGGAFVDGQVRIAIHYARLLLPDI